MSSYFLNNDLYKSFARPTVHYPSTLYSHLCRAFIFSTMSNDICERKKILKRFERTGERNTKLMVARQSPCPLGTNDHSKGENYTTRLPV